MTIKYTTAILFAILASSVNAQSLPKAQMLFDHGLAGEAQRELIDVVFSPGNPNDKAKALNLLATIAIDKNNLKAALDAWNRLIRDFPKTPEAISAKTRIPLLASALGQIAEESVDDATARVYLRSGDFWAKERDRIFRIDASWIPKVEAATYWYDRVIAEFPNTSAARIAYEDKMRTLLGWKEPGQYGENQGAKASASYLAELEATFREYEKAYPTTAGAQGFRFLISQAYWQRKDWLKTREWLNEILEKDGSGKSFYKDLAERRLKKVEY